MSAPAHGAGDRFQLSARQFTDADWFGLAANEEGTINVPFEDPYQGFTDPHGPDGAAARDIPSTSWKGATIMSGETTITVIGNLTGDPELRFTPSGSAVANFTIASTPRTFDRQSSEWKDGETLFLRASVWREAAENVAGSLTKGMRVIITGRLKSRSYETKEGEKRTVIELEVDEIGPSLRYATAQVTRAASGGGGGGGQRPQVQQSNDEPWSTPGSNSGNSGADAWSTPGSYGDDTPF